ncbi:MAG: spore maturation protein [Lachnospiraceae bacterium]|nr:spore maturation protein [Lachnospiraceae bacterium]
MEILMYLSDFCIPLLLFYMISYGLVTKTDIYKEFTEGAKDGFQVTFGILPTLIGLMTGVGMLRASGFLDFLSRLLSPIAEAVLFPAELVPLVVVKLFSSSAATGLVLDIFKEFGPDSYLGKVTSLLCSSTETVFYTMSVYFMAAGVKKTRYTLAGALTATAAGVAVSTILGGLI